MSCHMISKVTRASTLKGPTPSQNTQTELWMRSFWAEPLMISEIMWEEVIQLDVQVLESQWLLLSIRPLCHLGTKWSFPEVAPFIGEGAIGLSPCNSNYTRGIEWGHGSKYGRPGGSAAPIAWWPYSTPYSMPVLRSYPIRKQKSNWTVHQATFISFWHFW